MKLTNIDSITVNRNLTSDSEVKNKKIVGDAIGERTIVRFNQTLQNYLKVSVGKDVYNLTKYNEIQLIDTTIIKQGNGQYLLPRWKVICNDKNTNGVTTNFIRATKINNPTSQPGTTSLPPIGESFMYVETSSNDRGHERVFVSWEKTDIIQISNITYFHNGFSNITNDSLKSMGRFRNELFLEDNIWSIRYNIPKNDRYSATSTDWTRVILNFTVKNYDIGIIFDQMIHPKLKCVFQILQ